MSVFIQKPCKNNPIEDNTLIFTPDKDFLLSFQEILQELNPADKISKIIIYDAHPRKIFKIVFRNCILIRAAGGLVLNDKDDMLFIKRFGVWDLPKGKIEKNEKPPVAALREVGEECGINKLNIIKKLSSAYHIYIEKDIWLLKKTYWFLMRTSCTDKPVPQLKEHITEVVWCNKQKAKQCLKNTYGNIRDVVGNYAKANTL